MASAYLVVLANNFARCQGTTTDSHIVRSIIGLDKNHNIANATAALIVAGKMKVLFWLVAKHLQRCNQLIDFAEANPQLKPAPSILPVF